MSDAYEPLPPGDFTRVLEVQRVSTGPVSHEFVCSFTVVQLSKCAVDYTAISYAWEDSRTVSRITLRDGGSLPLSQTLSDLFVSLRRAHQSFTIWVDALCINQACVQEKEAQVRLMGQVYSAATQVLVWLGASNEETRTAFRFMQAKQGLSWPKDWEKELRKYPAGLREVYLLLARPWFHRAWVVQEVTLNSRAAVLCGADSVDFDVLRDCVFAIWKFYPGINDYADAHPTHRGLWNVTRLLFVRQRFDDDGAVPFEQLLELAYHCEATDPRDKVFAFWGIADHSRPVPPPTYHASVDDVYTQTAAALLCHGTSLDVLALAGIAVRSLPSELPSWVPDLRNHSFDEPYVSCNGGRWDCGGPVRALPLRTAQDRIRLGIKVVDVVSTTCPVFDSTSVANQRAAMRAVTELRKGLGREVSDDEWTDLLSQSLIFGLDIDDVPAGPAYRGYFLEWFQWLQSSSSEADLKTISGNRFQATIGPRIDGWNAFQTKGGLFCIGPPEVTVGDVLCVAPGCRFPLVLRSEQLSLSLTTPDISSSGEPPESILVSWCYAYGLMHGKDAALEKPVTETLLR